MTMSSFYKITLAAMVHLASEYGPLVATATSFPGVSNFHNLFAFIRCSSDAAGYHGLQVKCGVAFVHQ